MLGWGGVADDECRWLPLVGQPVAVEAVDGEVPAGCAGDDLVLALAVG